MNNSCNIESKPKGFKNWLKAQFNLKTLIAIVIGGFVGWLYYYFVGCSSGTCPITSNSFLSILFGAYIGFFFINRPCSSCSK